MDELTKPVNSPAGAESGLNVWLCVDNDDLVPDGYFERLSVSIGLLPKLPDEDITNDPKPLV